MGRPRLPNLSAKVDSQPTAKEKFILFFEGSMCKEQNIGESGITQTIVEFIVELFVNAWQMYDWLIYERNRE